MTRSRRMTTEYAQDLRLFRSRWSQVGLALAVLLYVLLPQNLTDFWLTVLVFAGIYAIAAIGLNLLTGFTGQVSLGHAFFIGVGAYTAAYAGAPEHWHLPFLLWLALAGVVAGVIGALVGPFALRLRGNYLAIVSVGLVFIGQHIFQNWKSVTGGGSGTSVPGARIGSLDFTHLNLANQTFTKAQSYFYLVWPLVALTALVATNIVRSRPGRAMQAVRDRDVAAEVVGVQLARTKVGAFAISSAMAGIAGALFGSFQLYAQASQWDLFFSIQFLAIIIVGGVATIQGSILGAIAVGGAPRIIERYASSIPLIAPPTKPNASGLTVAQASQLLYGLLIVFFLIVEPHGLAGVWRRVKTWFATWPFSY